MADRKHTNKSTNANPLGEESDRQFQIDPVHKTNLIDEIVEKIAELIRRGYLQIGSKLPPEPSLAKELRVSRSSLREALKALSLLGIIRARAGDGTYIADSIELCLGKPLQFMVLLKDIVYFELYELRSIVEPELAALAAERAQEDDLERMDRALKLMEENDHDLEAFLKYEIEFHQAFIDAAGNRPLSSFMKNIEVLVYKGRSRVVSSIPSLKAHINRHRQIYEAVKKKDAEAARRCVRNDIAYGFELLQREDRLRRRKSES